MKNTLATGLTDTMEVAVDAARTIEFMGDKARVYATPYLIRDMEIACRRLLLAHLDDGEDSVGTRVEVDHLAPTLAGMTVQITTRVAELRGRTVCFEVSAENGLRQILRGRHHRKVLDVKATEARLADLLQEAGLGKP